MQRKWIRIAALAIVPLAVSCATEPEPGTPPTPAASGPSEPAPMGEEDVIVLTPTRELEPETAGRERHLGWYYDRNKNGQPDPNEKEWGSRGSLFAGAGPARIRQDTIAGIRKVEGLDARGHPHEIRVFKLSKGELTIRGVHLLDTLTWWVTSSGLEVVPFEKTSFDPDKIAEEWTVFTTESIDGKSQLQIYVDDKFVDGTALILHR